MGILTILKMGRGGSHSQQEMANTNSLVCGERCFNSLTSLLLVYYDFQFVLLWSFCLFFKGKERVKNWVAGENLRGTGKGESVIKMYCMKKNH